MGNKKWRVENFLLFDYRAVEAHLSKMAAKGWFLTKVGRVFWVYKKAESRRCHFAVTYFENATRYNPAHTQEQKEFIDFCEKSGWKWICEWEQMQIFCSEQKNPIPIETDETVRLNTIHRAMKKGFLPFQGLLLIVFLNIMIQSKVFSGKPLIDILSSNLEMSGILNCVMMGTWVFGNLIGYAVWYFRSKKAVASEGGCINSDFVRKISNILLLLWMMAFLSLTVCCIQKIGFVETAVIFVYVIGLIVLAWLITTILKRAKLPAKANQVVTIIIIFLIILATVNAVYNTPFNLFLRQPVYSYE